MNELNISLHAINQLDTYEEYSQINGYYLGNDQFALRQAKSFSLQEVKEIRLKTNKQLFIVVNKLMHNSDLAALTKYLLAIDEIGVDFVVFSDFAVYQIAINNNCIFKMLYATETTITNNSFTKLAADYQIAAIEAAREITFDEVKEICNNKDVAVSLNLHGHMYMYQSVRKLISNYKQVSELDFNPTDELFLYDSERNKYYPIVENEQGTHMLASNDLCLINHLDKVKLLGVDYLKIDGFGYKKEDFEQLVILYIKALEMDQDTYKEMKRQLLLDLKTMINYKNFDSGFSFKETMY